MRPAVVVFLAAVIACAIAHVAIVASVVARGSRAGDANVPRPHVVVEILWALIPALALAFLLTATWPRVRDNAARPAEVLRIAR
jgi:heme/copper-type cytochrome/quinol oxidase subunit 2